MFCAGLPPLALNTAQVPPDPLWQTSHEPQCRRTDKSFLLLFLEKEGLSCLYYVSAINPVEGHFGRPDSSGCITWPLIASWSVSACPPSVLYAVPS